MTEDQEPVDAEALLKPLHEQRGAYLDVMCTLEVLLDSVLMEFFELRDFPKQRLCRATILTYVGFKNKVDALRIILVSEEKAEAFKPVFKALEAANDFRNTLAHSMTAMNLDGALQFVRFRGKNNTPVPMTAEELAARVTEVHRLLNAMHLAFATLRADNPASAEDVDKALTFGADVNDLEDD